MILIAYFPLFLFSLMLASLKTNIGSPGLGLKLVIVLDLVIVIVLVIALGLVLELDLDYHLDTPSRRITPVEFIVLFLDYHRITATDYCTIFG